MRTPLLKIDLQPPNRTKGRVLVLLTMAATAVLLVVAYSVLQNRVFVGDDLERGQRFATVSHPSMTRCTLATRALYNQPEFGYNNSNTSRAARAFFRGCSGVSYDDGATAQVAALTFTARPLIGMTVRIAP